MGYLVDRVHRELTDEDISNIAKAYHAWRGEEDAGEYCDIPGFCKSERVDIVKSHNYVLTPGRYVGTEAIEDDSEPFDDKMNRLTDQLGEQFKESAKLEKQIVKNLEYIGFPVKTGK
jgi:type I restriction enzyme M protein